MLQVFFGIGQGIIAQFLRCLPQARFAGFHDQRQGALNIRRHIKIAAAISDEEHGLIENWLLHVRDIHRRFEVKLSEIENQQDRLNRFCELNVIAQALNVGSTTIVRDAWSRNQDLTIHAIVYSINDGLLKDLGSTMSSQEEHTRLATVEGAANMTGSG